MEEKLEQESLSIPLLKKALSERDSSKVNYWKEKITNQLLEKDMVSLDVETSTRLFILDTKNPKQIKNSFSRVFIEMLKEGSIIEKKNFLEKKSAVGTVVGYTLGGLYSLSSGIFNMITQNNPENEIYPTPEGVYVFLKVINPVSKKLLKKLYSDVFTDGISHFLPFTTLQSIFSHISKRDLKLMLHHLETKSKAKKIYYGKNSENYGYKFPFSIENKSTIETNDYDKHIFSILEIKQKLEKKIEELSKEYDSLTKEAKLLISKNKTLARQTLKKRTLINNHLQQKTTSYNNAIHILLTISSSIENNMVVDLYKISNNVLTSINNTHSIEEVEEIIDKVEESIQTTNEIGNILQGSSLLTEEELIDKELEDLISSEKQEKQPTIPKEEEKEQVVKEEKPTTLRTLFKSQRQKEALTN